MTSEKILIVDDAPANISLLAGVLEPRGYEILTASTADQALRIATRGRPDVILLDVVMPGGNGFAVCRQLKTAEATRAIPVLFVTAKDDTESQLRGFRYGAVDYISKPFEADEAPRVCMTWKPAARATSTIGALVSDRSYPIEST